MRLSLQSDFLLLVLFEGLPLRLFLLDGGLVIVNELFLTQLEVPVNLIDALFVVLLDLDLLVFDDLISVCSD